MTVTRIAKALNIDDLERLARRNLPRGLFDFIDRGAEDEVTRKANAESIKAVRWRQRVGVDVSARDISTTVFGTQMSMPLGIAVTGLSALIDHDGERKLARAAAAAGIPYTIGTSNFAPQSDLKPICGDLLWKQIYTPPNRRLLDHQLGVSREHGVKVLQVTMDSPVVGNREYMLRSGWAPKTQHLRTYMDMLGAPRWLFGTLLRYMATGGFPEIADMPEGERKFWGGSASFALASQAFTWESLRDLRRQWDGVLVAKGLSSAQDARMAADCGVDGIIVSNHGGRSLDGCVASFEALPAIVDAVAPRVAVIVDGGFRRGADVLKAIAMGASMVMVGRTTLFGLAAGGEAGVARTLEIYRTEMDRALALIGASRLADLGREHLVMPGEQP